ncbi:MAG: DedA family protein [Propionibacteriaceae bacterium]|jgi:membrane protein DedA with SNARE-associated domain|nr:DedA family protein [Propionibacteriaceae bacterium]
MDEKDDPAVDDVASAWETYEDSVSGVNDETEPGDEEEKPWWDDPSMPWKHKPTRSDLVCWALIAVVGIYGLALLPLRAILIGWSPPAAAMITGGRTSVVATGAWYESFGGPIIVYWLVAAVSLVKFSWVYWWAGKLWGTGIVDLFSGQSARARRRAERAVSLTNRFSLLAIFLTFLPIPFPMPVVYAAIGAAGTPLKRFLPPVILISTLFQAGYLTLGWWIGEPAVAVVNLYAKFMWYVALGMIAVMIATWWWRERAKRKAGKLELY